MFDEPQVECVTAELAAVCEVAARIRTNNPLECILREIRWRTRVVGAFPDGLRHIAGTAWSRKRYPNIETALKARDAQV
jgi:hypothetical protein